MLLLGGSLCSLALPARTLPSGSFWDACYNVTFAAHPRCTEWDYLGPNPKGYLSTSLVLTRFPRNSDAHKFENLCSALFVCVISRSLFPNIGWILQLSFLGAPQIRPGQRPPQPHSPSRRVGQGAVITMQSQVPRPPDCPPDCLSFRAAPPQVLCLASGHLPSVLCISSQSQSFFSTPRTFWICW